MFEATGKENAGTKVIQRAKPTLVEVGKRTIISNGNWNDELMADYVSAHGTDKWLEVGKLAAVLGANTIPNKKRVRGHLSGLYVTFLKRGQILAVDYSGEHNAAVAVKVADIKTETDWQAVKRKLDRMKSSKDLTEKQYCAAIGVVTVMNAARR